MQNKKAAEVLTNQFIHEVEVLHEKRPMVDSTHTPLAFYKSLPKCVGRRGLACFFAEHGAPDQLTHDVTY